jgi:hypothetical protein
MPQQPSDRSVQRRRAPISSIDVIHVGFHKCASTTLRSCVFGATPSIAYTREARCLLDPDFDVSHARWHFSSDQDPRVYVVTSEAICGVDYETFEGNPQHLIRPARVYRVRPESKVLMVIRRQADIIRAYYTESIIKVANTKPFKFVYERSFLSGYFLYDQLIQKYQENYGPENVLILPVEELNANPALFLGKLSVLLGVDVTGSRIAFRNPGGARFCNEVVRLANHVLKYRDQRPIAYRKKIWRDRIDRRLGKYFSMNYYSAEQEQRIRDFYAESNIRTSSMIGIDLRRQYGY